MMADWTPEQLADQKRFCGCGHLKNTHASGEGKCLFAQLQKVNGYPGEAECLCETFVEDVEKTKRYIAEGEEAKKLSVRIFGSAAVPETEGCIFSSPPPLRNAVRKVKGRRRIGE